MVAVAVFAAAAAADTTFAALQPPSPILHVPLKTALVILMSLTREYKFTGDISIEYM